MCNNPLISASDLAFAFADIGVRVVSPMSTTSGMYRLEPMLGQTDGVSYQRNEHTITIVKGSIRDLANDLAITVDRKPFVVQWSEDLDDGLKTKVFIAPATP